MLPQSRDPVQPWHFLRLPSQLSHLFHSNAAYQCFSHLGPSFSFPLSLLFSLICHTHCKEANPCSSEIWVHLEECVSFLTLQRSLSTNKRSRRGAGGREEDVEMLGMVWEREKKESSLWPLIWQDMKQLNGFGIWQNSFLQWAFTTRGIPWREATYVWAAVRTQRERENFRKRKDSRRVF